MPPSTVDPGFCQRSMHHCIHHLLCCSHGSSVLPWICSVTCATRSKTLPQSPGRELSKHHHPLGTQESSSMQERELPPRPARVELSSQMFSTFYCCVCRLLGLLALAHMLFSCLMSHHSSSCCRMTVCKDNLKRLFSVAYPKKSVG